MPTVWYYILVILLRGPQMRNGCAFVRAHTVISVSDVHPTAHSDSEHKVIKIINSISRSQPEPYGSWSNISIGA